MAAEWDILVVGGGPAGLSGAIVAADDGLRAGVVETATLGGELLNVPMVRDFPGLAGPTEGPELAGRLLEQLDEAGAGLELDAVESLEPSGDRWLVGTRTARHRARAVVLATGSRPRPLGLAAAERLRGRGVSDCAMCDGPMFGGRQVAVLGHDDIALSEAGVLAGHADSVTVLAPRPVHTTTTGWRREILELPNVSLQQEVEALDLVGDEQVQGIRYRDAQGDERQLDVTGIFVALGRVPAEGAFPVARDDDGAIEIAPSLETTARGVFAAGDVRAGAHWSAAGAIGDGVRAARAAVAYLRG